MRATGLGYGSGLVAGRKAGGWNGWLAGLVGALLVLSGCVTEPVAPGGASARSPGAPRGDDLLIVDCLLPGQIRKLGSQMTYLSARRPIRTSAQDCGIRGGEYTAYDRATYASALNVWLAMAQEGDPDAQNKVGEIYGEGNGRHARLRDGGRLVPTGRGARFQPRADQPGLPLRKGTGVALGSAQGPGVVPKGVWSAGRGDRQG